MKTKQLLDAEKKDAVFQASIEFIGTLTGMKPPPIETAPPETFAPFRAFTERVCEIFADIEADIAKPVEPVAWMRDGATSVLHNFVLSKPDSGPWIPLYTTPQEPADRNPYGWQVQGLRDTFKGNHAELDAKSEAARVGGTAYAFPIYIDQPAAAGWMPIETAPEEGTEAIVSWIEDGVQQYLLECFEDGMWLFHSHSYEHYCMVASAGMTGPKEIPPYTHWMPLPAAPGGAA